MKELDPLVEECLNDAVSELKRIDHLIYVSLKYTRTVDVIRNTVSRIISFYDAAMLCLFESLKSKKKIKEIPNTPIMKAETLQKIFNDEYVNDNLDFYLLLRKVMKADYDKREEYRRHVTMITIFEDKSQLEIDIDILEEYFKKTKGFINYTSNFVTGKKDD